MNLSKSELLKMIEAEIKKRAKIVSDAFDKKYPVAIEVCEEIFEIH